MLIIVYMSTSGTIFTRRIWNSHGLLPVRLRTLVALINANVCACVERQTAFIMHNFVICGLVGRVKLIDETPLRVTFRSRVWRYRSHREKLDNSRRRIIDAFAENTFPWWWPLNPWSSKLTSSWPESGKYLFKIWFESIPQFRSYRVFKISMVVAVWPWKYHWDCHVQDLMSFVHAYSVDEKVENGPMHARGESHTACTCARTTRTHSLLYASWITADEGKLRSACRIP